MNVICKAIHPEKTILEVAVSIIARSMDQVQYLDCVLLRHTLNNMIKLSLTHGDTLQTKL